MATRVLTVASCQLTVRPGEGEWEVTMKRELCATCSLLWTCEVRLFCVTLRSLRAVPLLACALLVERYTVTVTVTVTRYLNIAK